MVRDVWMNAAKFSEEKKVVVEIPLLFEKKQEDHYNYIIYLVLNKENQTKRVLKRKNMNEFKLKKILKNQKDLSKSKKISLLLDTNNKRAVVKRNLLSFLKEIKRI